MKFLPKKIATGATAISILLASLAGTTQLALADGTGQIEGGPGVYEAKNLTEGGSYSDNTNAKACEELQYSIRLHNSGFVAVNNINVKVDLPAGASTTNTSTATITYTDGIVPSTSDTTTVTLASSQTISFESGTTQLFNGNGQLASAEPDGVTGAGIGLGSLNGSTTEYLNFKAKVNCPTPPPPTPTFSCDALNITASDNRTIKISVFNTSATNGATFKNADISWGDTHVDTGVNPVVGRTHQYSQDGTYTIAGTAHFNVNGQDKTSAGPQCEQQVTFKTGKPPVVTPPAVTPTTPSSPSAPTTLVNTGPGSIVGLFAAVVALGTAAYHWVLRRRLSLQ